MKFLIDAQLPFRLKIWLISYGYDAIHTTDLPKGSLTHDLEIADIADNENRIVITKDSDFLKLKILKKKPRKLLIITTGNISNNDLLSLFHWNLPQAIVLFTNYDTVEINNSFVIPHNI